MRLAHSLAAAMLVAMVQAHDKPGPGCPAKPIVTVTVTARKSTATASTATPASTLVSSATVGKPKETSAIENSVTLTTKVRPSSVASSKDALSTTEKESAKAASTEVASTEAASITKAATTTAALSTAAGTSKAAEPTKISRSYPADIVDELQDDSMKYLKEYLKKKPSSSGCTLENASIRREWGDLSVSEREDYVGAVKCLQKLPSKSDKSMAPGAKSRFDDFLAIHMKMTDSIHNTANFLSWHRYYLFSYEKALKEECDYQGAHPYWNWDRYASDPANSPIFNGAAGSLGGASNNNECIGGPLKDMTVNLGPSTSMKYNPRCLKRDISKYWASFTTVQYSYPLITQSDSIGAFQDKLQSVPGVHVGGHFTIGGDPGGDIYTSPGDPAFYLHHAGVDRIWWIWQLQDLETRLKAVSGKVVGQSGRVGSLTDILDIGVNGNKLEIGDVMDTMSGGLCYIYV